MRGEKEVEEEGGCYVRQGTFGGGWSASVGVWVAVEVV